MVGEVIGVADDEIENRMPLRWTSTGSTTS